MLLQYKAVFFAVVLLLPATVLASGNHAVYPQITMVNHGADDIQIASASALVMDVHSKKILYASHVDQLRPV